MSVVFRYIFRKLLATFLMVTPVIVLTAWVTMSIKYVELIVSDNLSFFVFLKLILCVLPGVCGIILPICFLISVIIAVSSLRSNKELIVMMTSGKSALSLILPILALGCMVSSVVLYLQTTGTPIAYKSFENIKEHVKTQMSINLLKPQTFNVIGDSVIYVGSRHGSDLQNVFVSYIPKNRTSNTNIITAKRGALINNIDGMFIQLQNGQRQELDSANKVVSTLKFEILSYDITSFFKRFYSNSTRINYRTQSELLDEAQRTDDEGHRRNCLAEYHSRILISFLSVINALIVGIFLMSAHERGKGRVSSIVSFLCGVVCHTSVMLLLNTATKNTVMITYNYMIVVTIVLVLFFFFVRIRN